MLGNFLQKPLKRLLIVARGWSDRVEGILGKDCLIVDEVDHALLFPRVAAVVHHGGSGTTATAARAGVPQVIVPHILDQFYWPTAFSPADWVQNPYLEIV